MFLLAVASAGVNKFNSKTFVTNNIVEPPGEGNYVITRDGDKVRGKQMEYISNLVRHEIVIDGQHFAAKNVKGFRKDDIYYINMNNIFMRRIIHGKLNVYIVYKNVNESTGGSSMSYQVADYYVQEGEDGELKVIRNQPRLKQILSACPEAEAMVDMSAKQIRDAVKDDPFYLNKAFDIYNNGCKRAKR